MKFEIAPLPYAMDALEPHLSAETLELHYEKHHKGYMKKLRAMIEDEPEGERSLEELVRTADGGLFNNAAQVWNHDFYWKSLEPNGGGSPDGDILEAVESSFGSLKEFRQMFKKEATGHFGSGWVWLVMDDRERLHIISTHDAANPLQQNLHPLLTLDVWEHAYYVDYRNERGRYVDTYLDHLLCWDFAAANLKRRS